MPRKGCPRCLLPLHRWWARAGGEACERRRSTMTSGEDVAAKRWWSWLGCPCSNTEGGRPQRPVVAKGRPMGSGAGVCPAWAYGREATSCRAHDDVPVAAWGSEATRREGAATRWGRRQVDGRCKNCVFCVSGGVVLVRQVRKEGTFRRASIAALSRHAPFAASSLARRDFRLACPQASSVLVCLLLLQKQT
jgi:hypothetical protein